MNFFNLSDEIEEKTSSKRGKIMACRSFERGKDPVPEEVFVFFEDGEHRYAKLKDLVLIVPFW